MDCTYIKCNCFRLYSNLRQFARKVIKGSGNENIDNWFISFKDSDFDDEELVLNNCSNQSGFINETNIADTIRKGEVYPVENFITNECLRNQFTGSFRSKARIKHEYCKDVNEASSYWPVFIEQARIPAGYRNGGLLYTGFIKEYQEWCLPSWVWTNASSIRYYCSTGQIEKARNLGNLLLSLQDSSGGWIVRYDFSQREVKPLLAPNDSAYIANNAFISLYKATKEQKYLDSAVRCADWIIDTARYDGMVYFGYDTLKRKWERDHNIVDVGFTAGLFAELYSITKEDKYLSYLRTFTATYIRLFYDSDKKWFFSSLCEDDKARGAGFSRGQAWALEGLIPAYTVLQDERIKFIIEDTIASVISKQSPDGSWANDTKMPSLGADCKGTPIIAYSLQKWLLLNPRIPTGMSTSIRSSVEKAMNWCALHTIKNGIGAGGIYSYCYVGAIVHHHCTSTAFVYSSAYALELQKMLRGDIRDAVTIP